MEKVRVEPQARYEDSWQNNAKASGLKQRTTGGWSRWICAMLYLKGCQGTSVCFERLSGLSQDEG